MIENRRDLDFSDWRIPKIIIIQANIFLTSSSFFIKRFYRKREIPRRGRVFEHATGSFSIYRKGRRFISAINQLSMYAMHQNGLDMHSVCIKRSRPTLARPKPYFHRRSTPLPLSSASFFHFNLPALLYGDSCVTPHKPPHNVSTLFRLPASGFYLYSGTSCVTI